MKNGDETLWTIDELGAKVAEALRGPDYHGVSSGRVRDVPDLRTIRYYTTLGLLDRPAAMRGRMALYGPRHLLQLVAVKRLQAQGLSLAAVQERVVGLPEKALRRLAQAPAAVTNSDALPAAPSPRTESFWRVHSGDDDVRPAEERDGMQTVPLPEGMVLSLPATRAPDNEDLRVIRLAAAPLIELLKLRGLIGIDPPQPRKGLPRS
jgi:hypothetical protein